MDRIGGSLKALLLRLSHTSFAKLYFYIFIAVYPILPPYFVFFGLRVSSIMALIAFLCLIFSRGIRAQHFRWTTMAAFVGFFSCCFVSAFANNELFTTTYLTNLMVYFFAPIYVFVMIQNGVSREKTIDIVIAVAIILCFLSIGELFGFNVFSILQNRTDIDVMSSATGKRFGIWRIESSFGQSIAFAIYLTIVLALLFYRARIAAPRTTKACIFWSLLILFFNGFIVLTLSRFPIAIALLVDLVGFFAFLNKKHKLYFLVCAVAFATLIIVFDVVSGVSLLKRLIENFIRIFSRPAEVGDDNPLTYRLNLYAIVSRIIMEHPNLTGIGLRGNSSFYSVTNWFDSGAGVVINDSLDNGYLRIFVYEGYLGLFAWLLYYAFFAHRFVRNLVDKKSVLAIAGLLCLGVVLLNMWSVDRLEEARTAAVVFAICATHLKNEPQSVPPSLFASFYRI